MLSHTLSFTLYFTYWWCLILIHGHLVYSSLLWKFFKSWYTSAHDKAALVDKAFSYLSWSCNWNRLSAGKFLVVVSVSCFKNSHEKYARYKEDERYVIIMVHFICRPIKSCLAGCRPTDSGFHPASSCCCCHTSTGEKDGSIFCFGCNCLGLLHKSSSWFTFGLVLLQSELGSRTCNTWATKTQQL